MSRRVLVGLAVTFVVLLVAWPMETILMFAGVAFVALMAVGIYCLVDAAVSIVLWLMGRRS